MPISIDTQRFRERANPKTNEELSIISSIEAKVKDWEHPEKYLSKSEQAYLIGVYEKSHKALEDENKKLEKEKIELVEEVTNLKTINNCLDRDINCLIQAAKIYFNSGNLPSPSRLGAK